MIGEFYIKNLYDGIISLVFSKANRYSDKIGFVNVILDSTFIAEDIKFRLKAVALSKAMFSLRCVGTVVNDGETFYKPNTADEDAYEALRDEFIHGLYPALTKVREALYSAQDAIEYENVDTFRKACEIFEEACNYLNNLRKQAEISISYAKKSSRPIHEKLVPRSDATAKVAIMCESVFIHFKNAYAALISLNSETDAYNAATQQSKEAIVELPTDFAGTWEMFTVK
jgi:hypothetical protein